MRICVIYPQAGGVHTGNLESAGQWGEQLRFSGHEVRVAEGGVTGCCEVLVALHGVRGRSAIAMFKRLNQEGRVVVVLTGTDLYCGGGPELDASMRDADRLVVLQPKALDRIPERYHDKTRVIYQGAAAVAGPVRDKASDPFQVCVIGHLREVKDPLRTAEALRLLPPGSRIVVKHAGAVLEPEFRERVEREAARNGRFNWLGELPEKEVRKLMAGSQVMVISSWQEGGARVVGESIVEGTPIIAANSEGVAGLLGDDYGGYLPPGDTEALADLLRRAETEPGFLAGLKAECDRLAPQWDLGREREAWKRLVRDLAAS